MFLPLLHRGRSHLLILCLAPLMLVTGCTKTARLESHLSKADAAFEKKDLETARIEYMNAFQLKSDDPHTVARLGEIFLEQGEITPAAQFLNRAKELQPENLDVRRKLASIFATVGLTSNAVQEAEFILRKAPADGDALIVLAATANNSNDITATLERLQALLPAQQKNTELHLALGQLHQKNRDLPAAEAAYKTAQSLSPTNSKPALALGTLYFSQGNTNAAEAAFQTAVKLAPVESLETLRYADFKLKTGQVEEGRKILEAAVEQEADFFPALNALAEIALLQGRTNDSSALVTKVLQSDRDNRDALLIQSRLHMVAGDAAASIPILEKITQANQRDSAAHLQLAIAYRAQNDPLKALATLERALAVNPNFVEGILLRSEIQITRGESNDAIPDLVRVTTSLPQISQAHFLLASAYRARGTPNEALAVYSKMTQLFPKDPRPHHLAGTILRQQQRPAEARKAYEAALALEPDFLQSIDELIELDLQTQDYDAAQARVQVYLDKYPDKPMPLLLQAKVFLARKDSARALESLEKAIQVDPEFYPAHRALAQIYIGSNQHDQAIAKLTELVSKNSRDTASLLQLALLYEGKEQYAEARKTYERLLEVNPNSVPALNNLAYLLSVRFNELDRAAGLAQKARELAPYDPFSADTFGWIAFQRGDYQQALSVLRVAAERLAGEPEVQYHLGMAYYMTGAAAPARTALELAAGSTNDFRGKEIAQASLNLLRIDPAQATAEDLQTVNTALERNPQDFFAQLLLGQIQERKGEWENAIASYRAALKINPKAAVALVRIAKIQVENLNQLRPGMESARQAWFIAQDPASAALLGRLGVLAGDYRWALPLLEQAYRADSASPSLAYYLALVNYTQGRLENAAPLLSRIAKTDFPEAPLARGLADIIAFHQDFTKAPAAEKAAADLLQKSPDYPPARLVNAMLQERQSSGAARSSYEALVQKYPEFLLAHREYVLHLVEDLSADAAAAPVLARLRPLLPADAQLTKAAGILAFRRDDHREAARLLRQAAPQLPKDGAVYYYLGLAQHKLKDAGAKATLQQALALEADSNLAPEAKKALAEME